VLNQLRMKIGFGELFNRPFFRVHIRQSVEGLL
jgi:hypothetical protein